MMDLSQLSDADLQAISAGNMAGVSDQGLQLLAGPQGAAPLSPSERFVHGLMDPINGGTQLAAKVNEFLSNKTGGAIPKLKGDPAGDIARDEAIYDQRRGPDAGVDWLRVGGNLLSPVTIASMFVPGATIPRAAAIGAATGLLEPTKAQGDDFAEAKALQAAGGAVGGGAGNAALRTVARAVAPAASRNAQLQMLKSEGVEPTVGQALGGRLNALEEKLTSLPLMGDLIVKARGRARDTFNRAAMNRVLAPIGGGGPNTTIGREGVGEAEDAIGRVYDAARSAGNARLDRQSIREIRGVMDNVSRMPAQQQDTFRSLLDTLGTDLTPTGRIADFKRVDSTIGQRAARFSGSPDAYQRDLGDAMTQLRSAVQGGVGRRNPAAGRLFDQADDAYARLVRVQGAAGKANQNGDGVFSPGQLLSAVKAGDKTVRDRKFARGDALMQDLADAGQGVLGNKVPDSGTPGRMIPFLIGSGLGLSTLPTTTVGLVAGLSSGAVAYTPAVQRQLVRLVSQRGPGWQAAERFLRQAATHGAPAAAEVTNGYLN